VRPMDKLGDKRVGIIGTGATAVQCIPPLARAAKELMVFQRTPSSVDVRNNHPIDPGVSSPHSKRGGSRSGS
jgi:cation diffusion facilitator CzcD-associated flavoprotein CzcO